MTNEVQVYGDLEREQGLIALAMSNGNTRQAVRELKAITGRSPSKDTLAKWKREEPKRYAELRSKWLPKIREHAAEQHMASAEKRREIADELLDELKTRKGELKPERLSTAVRDLDVGSGIHTDKAEKLSDRDPAPPKYKSISSIVASLNAKGFVGAVEIQAEEEEVRVDGNLLQQG